MANPAKDMILFPSGGMSAEDIGDSQVQKPALEAVAGPGKADGDLPSIPGVSGYGEGPEVIQNKGPKYDSNCAPGKVGAE
jgi:hypothetical protein